MKEGDDHVNYITARAVGLAEYLIKKGMDVDDAIEYSVSKYIKNPKLDINRLMKEVKKEVKDKLKERGHEEDNY